MKRRIILIAVVPAMVAIIAGAFAWDCARAAAAHREQIRLADDELQKQEQRLIVLLVGSPQMSSETQAAIAVYESAKDAVARQESYDDVVATFRQTMLADVDATNPLARKFMDDAAGAINRRDVARDPYDVALADYRSFLRSFRGRIARRISSETKADYVTMAPSPR